MLAQWYDANRTYDTTGTPNLYSDMAIIAIHEIRQLFKLPLRQTQGLINAIFKMIQSDLQCPNYSVLSKRLKKLNLNRSHYRYTHIDCGKIRTIAIDSNGLKIITQDEWHEEKYGKNGLRDWRKIHFTVDNNHVIQTSLLITSDVQDTSTVNT